ncbi:MAG: pyruvate/2-oxoglutarate dehydrogenase complex dihydrolipoamide acyltransferase (E2) component, partial [Verrucomicrobiales bacterium]
MPRVPILMPQLGESIAEATIVRIDISPGDDVSSDDEIMEVETQKASMEITTSFNGKVAEITATVGESYPVGATLGVLEVSDEEATRVGLGSETPSPEENQPSPAAIPSEPLSERPRVAPTVSSLPVPAGARGATYLSPRMRARMDELDINASDLAGIPGSGAAGRVTVEDFEDFMAKIEQKKMTPASPMRIAVADSMRRSWSRPLATVGSPVQLDKLLAHRKT